MISFEGLTITVLTCTFLLGYTLICEMWLIVTSFPIHLLLPNESSIWSHVCNICITY